MDKSLRSDRRVVCLILLLPVLLVGVALAQHRVVHVEDVEPLREAPRFRTNAFETEIYDSSTSAAPSMIWADSRLFMFYKDKASGTVFNRFMSPDGVWSKPKPVANCVTESAPAVTYWREYFFIAYKGANSEHIYLNTMHLRSGLWTGAVKLVNGRTSSQPTLEIQDDKVVVVYRGAKDDKLYFQAVEYLPERAKTGEY